VPDRILGVDPGLSETGWALLEGGSGPGTARLLAGGCIRTPAHAPLTERLRTLYDELNSLQRRWRPDQAAIEEMFFLRAAHSVRSTLQARGVILLSISQGGVPVSEYNPRQVKICLTGSGSAPKAQMIRMIQAALGLPAPLTPDDVSDAAAIALCHLRSHRLKRLVVLDRLGGGARSA